MPISSNQRRPPAPDAGQSRSLPAGAAIRNINEAPLRTRIRRILDRASGHRYHPLVVALIAFASTAAFTLPLAIVLISPALVAPRRWLLLGVQRHRQRRGRRRAGAGFPRARARLVGGR